jgi:DNA-binding NtrC family response regulator
MKRSRILIADDEEGIREALQLILEDRYDLVFARDGLEALDKASTEGLHAVILDIKMPKLDGLEILKRIRKAKIDVPILILTAYQSVELAKEAIKLGAQDYLPKPFEREQILRVIEEVCSRRHD